MTTIEWTRIRRELKQLSAMVRYASGDQEETRDLRLMAADHAKTALLLLSGSTSAQIIGHPAGSHHNSGEDTGYVGQN